MDEKYMNFQQIENLLGSASHKVNAQVKPTTIATKIVTPRILGSQKEI